MPRRFAMRGCPFEKPERAEKSVAQPHNGIFALRVGGTAPGSTFRQLKAIASTLNGNLQGHRFPHPLVARQVYSVFDSGGKCVGSATLRDFSFTYSTTRRQCALGLNNNSKEHKDRCFRTFALKSMQHTGELVLTDVLLVEIFSVLLPDQQSS